MIDVLDGTTDLQAVTEICQETIAIDVKHYQICHIPSRSIVEPVLSKEVTSKVEVLVALINSPPT